MVKHNYGANYKRNGALHGAWCSNSIEFSWVPMSAGVGAAESRGGSQEELGGLNVLKSRFKMYTVWLQLVPV